MPNIPNVPGVPPLPSYAAGSVSLLVADVATIFSDFFGASWGIFLDGEQAFPYRSIVDFAYKQDWPVSDYQVEDGGFQSYDKVELPFDVKVRIASGGDAGSRQALLAAVKAAAPGLDLFDVVTPEQTYASCNITHVDFPRSADSGAGMIIVDLWFVEIRVTSTSTFSNTQSPTVAGQQNTGSVSPQAPSAAVSRAFDSGEIAVQ